MKKELKRYLNEQEKELKRSEFREKEITIKFEDAMRKLGRKI